MGLLSKAGHLETNKGLAFSEFINKYNFKICALFEKKDNFFLIKNSIGFDGASILSSYSTVDFWNGICDTVEELNIFTDDNGTLSPLLQLFSFSQKDDIESVAVYKPSNSKIFISCNQKFPKECIHDLCNLDENKKIINLESLNRLITRESKVIEMEVDFEEAVESFLQAQVKDKTKAATFIDSIYNEISNRFLCYFSKNVSVRINQHSSRAIFVVSRDLTQEHLINHIILNLSGVIGNYSEIINFNVSGIANSIPEIKEFLQVE
ncbi:MAG: hypothetical protein K5681_04855 [Treponema sp.]|nr:hypothetical protein [Treponema sp.]